MADQEMRLRCLAFVMIISLCGGFNLDPRFSVTKKGSRDNYFGYSVTEHQIVGADGSVVENLLLVGAPREKVLVSGKIVGGAIYKCNALTTSEQDCTRLESEPFNIEPVSIEDVEDQWLGIVLHSYGKGQKIVTCAHRYIQENAALGVCYTLLQTLEFQSKWIPCMGQPHTRYLEDFGLCQAGLSAALGPHEAMVIGSPGPIVWRGVVFQANISDELGTISGPFNSPVPVNPNEEGAATAQLPPTDKYSYLGYSVAIGKFDASGSLQYVSGAPRSNEKGEVVFFRKLSTNPVLRYEPEQKLQGMKDFAGFGSTLLALDLNNDKYDDLIVGAPYYFEKSKEVGGAIYIYYGGKKMIDSSSKYTVILSREMGDTECEELGCHHARFGMSLTKLGDVNNDGYQDFAVGAPYEGNGAVYIYHGSKDGVSKMYAQRIAASDMPGGENLKSFGYSLSGGLDLDANGYPDLLVGSYESGTISLLRSRAIIRLQAKVEVTPNKTDLGAAAECPFDNSLHRCVQLEICLTFTAEPVKSFSSRPIVKYQVEVERTRSFARLEMANSQDASKKFVEGSMTLYRQGSGRKKCETQLAYLKDVFADKLNPMELTVTFSQPEVPYTRPNPGEPLLDINTFPILSTEGTAGAKANTISTFVDFVKECGSDNKCISNLQFEAMLDLNKEGNRYILRDGEFSRADIKFIVTNLGEAAYLTQVYIQKPAKLDYQAVNTDGSNGDVKCLPVEDDNTLIVCDDIGNPLKYNASVTFTLKLSSRISSSDEELNITTWVNTSSTEQTPEHDKIVFPFIVIREADLVLRVNVRPDDQILCSGDPRGASAMKTEEDIGPAVNHSFIVTNRGPSNVSRSTLIIEWPLETGSAGANGKFLLYLMQAPIVEKGEAICYIEEKDTVNPLKITAVAPEAAPVKVDRFQPLKNTGGRQKRAAESESRVKRAHSGLVVLGCKQNTARCRKIRCELGNLQRGVGFIKITLRARLWESTLLQDYRKAGDVQISSYAYLEIDPALKIKQDTSNDRIEAVTYVVPDFKDSRAEALEWWWILLAVVGGIVLLILIIFILYKVGFFKRKRPEDMQMYQAEKKQQKMLEDYEDDAP